MKSLRALSDNVKQLHNSLGDRSKHRREVAMRVCKDLPVQFCNIVLGVKPTYLRKVRQRHRKDTNTPALFSEHRTETQGRVRHTEDFQNAVGRFLESRTEILSGANTHTRRLLMSKGRLEVEFEANYPALLRKVAEIDPSILPDPTAGAVLTKLQKNVIAARFASEQDGFCEAEEYQTRLNAALERSEKNA